MKTSNLYLTVFLCAVFSRALSQTPQEILRIQDSTDVRALEEFRLQSRLREEENWRRTQLLARQKGWALSRVDSKGRTLILRGVSEKSEPIYLEPLDSEDIISVRTNKLYAGGGLGLDLQGESMTAGVWESDPIRVSHQAFQGRVLRVDGPVFDPVNHSKVGLSHGTGVTGQVAAWGGGTNNTTPWVAPAPSYQLYGRAMGAAPKANVHTHDPWLDLTEATTAAAQGLLVSNHSYYMGGLAGSIYNLSAWDTLMYYAPHYLYVTGAGNLGGPSDKLNNGATLKNGIAAANVQDVLNYTGPSSVVISDGTEPSSRGPADDGRIKPDISAPGYSIRIVANRSDTDYTNGGGTSFAAPTVTGVVLLLQQHFTNINQYFMRSSTVKGLMLHTASEAGPNPGPDITFGFGLLNAEKAANAITQNGGKSFISEDRIAQGQSYSRELVASGTEPLVVTICWIDIPGTNRSNNDTTAVLVNDLDLRLSSGGVTSFPWKLDRSNVTGPALQGDNNRDNIEKIEIATPAPGQVYTLAVTHKGTLVTGLQKFSLIVTGLQECVADRTILSPVNSGSSDRQQASLTITAKNNVSAGAEAIYHATDEVLLQDGFHADSGSVFRAYLEGCTTNYAARKAAVTRPVVTYPTPLAENAESEDSGITVYPNPGNGIFVLSLNEGTTGKIRVSDLQGRPVLEKSVNSQPDMEIDITRQPPGVYIFEVLSDNKATRLKVVKY